MTKSSPSHKHQTKTWLNVNFEGWISIWSYRPGIGHDDVFLESDTCRFEWSFLFATKHCLPVQVKFPFVLGLCTRESIIGEELTFYQFPKVIFQIQNVSGNVWKVVLINSYACSPTRPGCARPVDVDPGAKTSHFGASCWPGNENQT
jgi:hypothetical protein